VADASQGQRTVSCAPDHKNDKIENGSNLKQMPNADEMTIAMGASHRYIRVIRDCA
jgi:hypothetical protein